MPIQSILLPLLLLTDVNPIRKKGEALSQSQLTVKSLEKKFLLCDYKRHDGLEDLIGRGAGCTSKGSGEGRNSLIQAIRL